MSMTVEWWTQRYQRAHRGDAYLIGSLYNEFEERMIAPGTGYDYDPVTGTWGYQFTTVVVPGAVSNGDSLHSTGIIRANVMRDSDGRLISYALESSDTTPPPYQWFPANGRAAPVLYQVTEYGVVTWYFDWLADSDIYPGYPDGERKAGTLRVGLEQENHVMIDVVANDVNDYRSYGTVSITQVRGGLLGRQVDRRWINLTLADESDTTSAG